MTFAADDLTGRRFERLLVVSSAGKNNYGAALWNCICDCGAPKRCTAQNLKRGGTRSCGCLAKEVNIGRKHNRRSSHKQTGKRGNDRTCRACGDKSRLDEKNFAKTGNTFDSVCVRCRERQGGERERDAAMLALVPPSSTPVEALDYATLRAVEEAWLRFETTASFARWLAIEIKARMPKQPLKVVK